MPESQQDGPASAEAGAHDVLTMRGHIVGVRAVRPDDRGGLGLDVKLRLAPVVVEPDPYVRSLNPPRVGMLDQER